MLSSECWLGYHEHCSAPKWCDCLCHVKADPMFAELLEYLMKAQENES